MTMMATTETACPKCGGNMWDNRATKTNPKQPDFKCKDRGCDGVIWPPRNGTAAPAAAKPTRQPISLGGPVAGIDAPVVADRMAADFALYSRCIDHARVEVIRTGIDKIGGDVAGAVAAIAATLYIQAHK